MHVLHETDLNVQGGELLDGYPQQRSNRGLKINIMLTNNNHQAEEELLMVELILKYIMRSNYFKIIRIDYFFNGLTQFYCFA